MTRKLIVSLDSGLTITVRPPTVRQFYEQRPALTAIFMDDYIGWVVHEHENDPN